MNFFRKGTEIYNADQIVSAIVTDGSWSVKFANGDIIVLTDEEFQAVRKYIPIFEIGG